MANGKLWLRRYSKPVKAFAGVFETHLTVGLPGRLGEGDEGLARWAERRGMKYAKILLDRGETWQQPMLTYYGSGMLSAQLALARWRAGERRRSAD